MTILHMDEESLMDDDARIHDSPFINLSNKLPYERLKTSVLSNIFLLVNLKVSNGVSNKFFK